MKYETIRSMYFYEEMDEYLCGVGEERQMPPYTPVKIVRHASRDRNRVLIETEQGWQGWAHMDDIQLIPPPAAPQQTTIFTAADDLPLFTGQPVECSKYDARGYQPHPEGTRHYRQLDMWKEQER